MPQTPLMKKSWRVKMKILWSILIYLFLIEHQCEAADYYHCYSTGNFTDHSSVYGGSRDAQLLGLAQLVKNYGGFYSGNTITVPPSPVPNCFGLCRKDLISDACYSCVTNATNLITQKCSVQKEVIAWGDDGGCIAQCVPPNQSSQLIETPPSVRVCNLTNVSQNHIPQFNQILSNLTSRIADKAATEGSSSKFPSGFNEPQYYAADVSNFSDLHQTIYAVGYCVPSLSSNECAACLKSTSNESFKHCPGKQGAIIMTTSCVFRFELYRFYQSAPASPVLPMSPPRSSSKDVNKGTRKKRAIVAAIVFPLLFVLTVMILILRFQCVGKKGPGITADINATVGESMESCLQFSLNTIRIATDNFSESNKLGEGGFGAVYKGRLPSGLLVAVKRLTKSTGKEEEEFKNEVQLVARLHHKNLIRLIGFSMGVKERILIYELAPNGSLDHILFDSKRREHLTWEIRQCIIEGIARGLLYLHDESQLRIIHRDLKASNVLLDASLNPKISDFGTARLYAEDHCSASKIVGTYGYLAPEYAKYGKLSSKVDVFSFGVLLLEIVSGSKNNTSLNGNSIEHLLSRAWNCWTSGELLEFVDPVLLRQSSHIDQITRFIHVGLLCVQENATCRPSMNSVVLNLDGSSLSIPPPLEPAYLMQIRSEKPKMRTLGDYSESQTDSTTPDHGTSSVNEISLTHTYPEPR